MTGKLWGGRFAAAVDPDIHRFTAALGFDRRMARCDLVGCLAHARMLRECGVVGADDGAAILEGLSSMLRDYDAGELAVAGEDEDVHTWIERVLTERIGDPGRRLHTARSRNDQTGLALRLYVREALAELRAGACLFQEKLLSRSHEHVETWMPGYTHLQRGQPVSLAHHLLAHFWALEQDQTRLVNAFRGASLSPLGAAALAGSPHDIDPVRSAELLGLDGVYENSMLAVTDRDYVLEATFACTVVMLHLSRFASEVILWTTSEFSFAHLGDSIAKGSSIMPQKRNPEPAEILRGKTGRVVGDLMALATVVKGLPFTYNSDLQEDKESLFDALDTTSASLEGAAAILDGLHFDKDRMSAALHGGFLTATDLADHLASRGTAFRSAHHQAGLVVRLAEERGCELWELSVADIQALCPDAGDDVLEALAPEGSVASRSSYGGPAPERVRGQIVSASSALARSREWLAQLATAPIEEAHRRRSLLEEAIP